MVGMVGMAGSVATPSLSSSLSAFPGAFPGRTEPTLLRDGRAEGRGMSARKQAPRDQRDQRDQRDPRESEERPPSR